MEHPHVQFHLNQELDQWTAREFNVGTTKQVIEFYNLHQTEIDQAVSNMSKLWDSVANSFFAACADIFHRYPWPVGEYIGYASMFMFNCNPRFLNNKTFQVYYKYKAGPNYITAHEMLHFLFYDYAAKNFPDLFDGKDTESGIFWDVAEVFNSVSLHAPPLVSVHGFKEKIIYPEHKNWVKHMSEGWDQNIDIDHFIVEAYKLISE